MNPAPRTIPVVDLDELTRRTNWTAMELSLFKVIHLGCLAGAGAIFALILIGSIVDQAHENLNNYTIANSEQ